MSWPPPQSFATSPGYLRTVRATWSTRPRYLRWALAEEPAQPAETAAEVVDHEAASSSPPWHGLTLTTSRQRDEDPVDAMKGRGLRPPWVPNGCLGVLITSRLSEAAVNQDHDGGQYVGIDLHRRRSVLRRLGAPAQRPPGQHR